MTTKSLEQQIAELTAEHNFKSEMQTLLGQYNPLAYKSGFKDHDFTVSINLRNQTLIGKFGEHLSNIVNILKPTTDKVIIGTAGGNETTHYSPFRMDYVNNVNDCHVLVSYISNRIQVRVEMPVDFYKSVSKTTERKVYESEYHYFTGQSYKRIQNIRLQKYECLYWDSINWYGGNSTPYIKDAEYREQFERMLFTGEQPLG